MSKYEEYIQKIKNAPGGKETGTQAAMVEFARFLSELAKDAETTTEKNLKLQERVVNLTWAILILTVFLSVVGLYQILN